MSWLDRFARLPLVASRAALRDATRKLQENKRAIEELRARVEKQKQRLDEERRRCERLERRLADRKVAKRADARPLTPHRQAFRAATSADGYRVATVVSYPKSGRTWFSTLYFHYARHFFGLLDLKQQSLHMPDRNVAFQQLLADNAKGGVFPVCVFTHLGFSSQKPFEVTGVLWPDKAHTVLKKPCVLIVRDPRDVVISHFHHLQSVGGVLDPGLNLSEFVHSAWGIERIVRFMNLWAQTLQTRHVNLHLVTFESLKRDTAGTFSAAMCFLGNQVDDRAVAQAIEESRFDRLRERELSNRSYQGASLAPDAFRFRKGDVGGYARELSEADAAYLNEVVSTKLDPTFSLYHSG